MTDRAPILVLGLGNELFTDEGLGIHAARRIEAMGLDGVDVLDGGTLGIALLPERSEEHTSELQSHSFISYAVFCLKKKKKEKKKKIKSHE